MGVDPAHSEEWTHDWDAVLRRWSRQVHVDERSDGRPGTDPIVIASPAQRRKAIIIVLATLFATSAAVAAIVAVWRGAPVASGDALTLAGRAVLVLRQTDHTP